MDGPQQDFKMLTQLKFDNPKFTLSSAPTLSWPHISSPFVSFLRKKIVLALPGFENTTFMLEGECAYH